MNQNDPNKIDPDLDPKRVMINGPINVARLEGVINGIKKVIYLFMDHHLAVWDQTECSNVFSKDIQQYLVDSFHNLNTSKKKYDFFLEIYPTMVSIDSTSGNKQKYITSENKQKYIFESLKYFNKIFNYDKNKNKVLTNPSFNNIRFHYMDIRDYLEGEYDYSDIQYISSDLPNRKIINGDMIQGIINLLEKINSHIQFIIETFKKSNKVTKKNIIKEFSKENLNESIIYLIHKMKTKYKHKDIKKKINQLIDKHISNISAFQLYLFNIIQLFRSYMNILDENNNYSIKKRIEDTIHLLLRDHLDMFVFLTDYYFLRRFLDKDYITNAIVYTGALHSANYIDILVKKFEFKVTHIYYPQIDDYDKFNEYLKNASFDEIFNMIKSEKMIQCVEMTDFPSDFS